MALYDRLMDLIHRGPKVKCSVSGKYFLKADTNDDGKGGRVYKKYDVFDKRIFNR